MGKRGSTFFKTGANVATFTRNDGKSIFKFAHRPARPFLKMQDFCRPKTKPVGHD